MPFNEARSISTILLRFCIAILFAASHWLRGDLQLCEGTRQTRQSLVRGPRLRFSVIGCPLETAYVADRYGGMQSGSSWPCSCFCDCVRARLSLPRRKQKFTILLAPLIGTQSTPMQLSATVPFHKLVEMQDWRRALIIFLIFT